MRKDHIYLMNRQPRKWQFLVTLQHFPVCYVHLLPLLLTLGTLASKLPLLTTLEVVWTYYSQSTLPD